MWWVLVAVVTVLTPDLDSNDAPPFKNEVTSFQVLVGGTAELDVHLLIDTERDHSQTSEVIYTHYDIFFNIVFFLILPYFSVALHGRRSVDRVTMQTVTWHLMAYHTCDNHPGVNT